MPRSLFPFNEPAYDSPEPESYSTTRRRHKKRQQAEDAEMARHFAEATGEGSKEDSLQKRIDKVLEREPLTYRHDALLGSYDMAKNFATMVLADTVGADKYYHCKGNCEATKRGIGGRHAATALSELRELYGDITGDPAEDREDDQKANRHGRRISGDADCGDHCSRFRPSYLRDKWR